MNREEELKDLIERTRVLLENKTKETTTATTAIDPELASQKDTEVTFGASVHTKEKRKLKDFLISKALRGIVYDDWTDAGLERDWIKSMYTTPDTAGGFLLPETVRLEFIEALGAEAVVRRAGAFVTSLGPGEGETAKIPREDTGVTGAWVGQTTPPPAESTPTIGQLQLTLKEWVARTHIHDRLIRAASPLVEPIVRQMIVKSAARAEDLAFLQGQGGALEPLGLINQPGISSIAIGALTFDSLLDMMYQIEQANGTYTAWIMHPRTKNTLRGLKDNQQRPLYAVDPSAAIRDTIYGLPALFTTQIPINLGAGANESYILLGDWSKYYILDGGGIEITADASERFSHSEVVVKGVLRVDGAPATPKTFCVGTGVLA